MKKRYLILLIIIVKLNLAFSSDVLFFNKIEDDKCLWVTLDIAKNELSKEIKTNSCPDEIIWNTKKKEIYFENKNIKQVIEVDTDNSFKILEVERRKNYTDSFFKLSDLKSNLPVEISYKKHQGSELPDPRNKAKWELIYKILGEEKSKSIGAVFLPGKKKVLLGKLTKDKLNLKHRLILCQKRYCKKMKIFKKSLNSSINIKTSLNYFLISTKESIELYDSHSMKRIKLIQNIYKNATFIPFDPFW